MASSQDLLTRTSSTSWNVVPHGLRGRRTHPPGGRPSLRSRIRPNDWAADDLQGRTSSELVADLVPGARVVKAGNTLGADVLGSDPQGAGGRRVIFISGDDADANVLMLPDFDRPM
jgi:hypothetical protein